MHLVSETNSHELVELDKQDHGGIIHSNEQKNAAEIETAITDLVQLD